VQRGFRSMQQGGGWGSGGGGRGGGVGAPDGCGADESRGLPWGVSRRWELPTRESEGSEGKAPKREASLPPPSERRMQGSRMDPNPVWRGILFGVAKCSFKSARLSVCSGRRRERRGGAGAGNGGRRSTLRGESAVKFRVQPTTDPPHASEGSAESGEPSRVCGDRGKGKQKKKKTQGK